MKSEWAALLQETLAESAEVVPAAWHRAAKVAGEWGRSEVHTRALLKRLVASGKAECRVFRVAMVSGVVKPIPHYRISSDNRTRTTPRTNKG